MFCKYIKMVLSEIDRSVEYKEDSAIEKVDDELNSLIYPIEIAYEENGKMYYKKYKIVFGKKNQKYMDSHHIIFHPIYLVVDDVVKAKIGILEVEKDLYKHILDVDQDIDPDKMPEPLLFSFVNEAYLSKYKSQPVFQTDLDLTQSSSDDDSDEDEKPIRKPTDHDDLFVISSSTHDVVNPKKSVKIESIFETDVNKPAPKALIEETKQQADAIREEYTEGVHNQWMEDFMKNHFYKTVDNEGRGDCLFLVVVQAYAYIGQVTTVDKLRQLLAEEANEDLFQQYRNIYLSMENSILENNSEIQNSVNQLKIIKDRIRNANTERVESQKLLSDAKLLQKRVEELKNENKENQQFLNYNFGFMKDIDTHGKLQEFIQTSQYWADSWAISKLEEKLNMKFIIFSEESFRENALDSVMQCGDSNVNIQQHGKFTPNYYIMTSYNGMHYSLITYKDKRIFEYKEIPYDIKMLIMNKCMERNAGIFDMISDFKHLKTKLGIHTTDSDSEEEMDSYMQSLYDSDVIFVLGPNAPNKKYPGTAGNGEHIPEDKKAMFIWLSKIPEWRRKLHDSWVNTPFNLDGHRWTSVEHYYQASKFRKGFPDFYTKFSLDYPSDLSKKVEVAKLAGGKDGKKYRDKKYSLATIDSDFYEGRHLEERSRAIEAKMTQNEDIKQILLMTGKAKLTNFARRTKCDINEPLMSIRKKLQQEK